MCLIVADLFHFCIHFNKSLCINGTRLFDKEKKENSIENQKKSKKFTTICQKEDSFYLNKEF